MRLLIIRRIAHLLCWLTLAPMGYLGVTLALQKTGPFPSAVLQAIAPLALMPAWAIVTVAVWRRRWLLSAASGSLALTWMLLVLPVAFAYQPKPAAGAVPLRVMFANLRFDNDRPDEAARTVAAASSDVDVVALVEFTPAMAKRLQDLGLYDRFPNHVMDPQSGSGGIGLLSKLPISSSNVANLGSRMAIRAELDVNGKTGLVYVVHPVAPTELGARHLWVNDLAIISRVVRSEKLPTLVVGDFNATYWHPAFRRLMGSGLVDAHAALGQAFHQSWPNNQMLPPFVRIDHALTNRYVAPTHLRSLDIPGDDHRGFVVDVAVAPIASPTSPSAAP